MLRLDYIKRFATVLMAAGVALVSCMEMAQPRSEAVGYLTVPMLGVDVTVQDMAQTKASKPAVEAPATSDIRLVVKDKDGNVKYDDEGLWSEPLVLPVGAYTVEATYGENGFGAAYFAGTVSGTIDPLDNEVPVLTVSLANSMLCVEIDPEFAQHFDIGSSKALLKSGSASAEVAYGEWIFVPSGVDLQVAMNGTTAGKLVSLTHTLSNPSPKVAYNVVCKKSSTSWPSITWQSSDLSGGAFESGLYFMPATASNMSDANAASLTYQVKGGSYSDWTDVTVSDVSGYKYISGLSNGMEYSLRACVGNIVSEELSFTPVTFQSCFSMESVTSAHNNDGNADVELSSTTMTANNMTVNLPSIVAGMATVTAAGSFSSSNNDAAGSFSDVTLSSSARNVSFTNASGWPYLPQGAYSATVTATCTLNGATYTATAAATPSVPAPVLGLAMSSYTSYDKYAATNSIAKDLNGTSGANNCDPSTLYNAGGKWNVSTSLMSNANYAKKLVVKIDDDEFRTLNVTNEYADNKYYEPISGLSWTSHNLSVSFTFDGTTVNKSQTHHITGLPYSYNFVGGSLSAYAENGWKCNGSLEVSNKSLAGRATTLLLDRNSSGSNKHGFVVSPRFHIPDNLSVQPSVVRSVYRTSGNKERTGYIGPVSNDNTTSKAISYTVSGGTSTSGSVVGSGIWLTGFQLTASTPYVAIDSDERSEIGWSYYFLHEVHLRYM